MLECRFQFAEAARSNTVHRNASFSLKRPMHTPQQPTCAKRDGDGRIGLVLDGVLQRPFKAAGGFPAGLPLWPGGHQVGLPT
jgi:hypothetical protein